MILQTKIALAAGGAVLAWALWPKKARASVAQASHDLGLHYTPAKAAASHVAPWDAPGNIINVQKSLNLLGASPSLAEDGVKGPLTTQALSDFQRKVGLQVTGAVDAQTATALNNATAAVMEQGAYL